MENLQNDIQAYVNGQLSGAELTAFEAQLKIDTALSEEVKLYRQLQFAMQNSELIDMNRTLSIIRLENADIRPDLDIDPAYMPKKPSKTWQWWAAGVLILSLLSLVLWQYQKSLAVKNAQQISTALLQDITPFENIISLANDDKSPLAEGMRHYEAKNYTAAIPLLKLHTQRQPTDAFSKLYLGISYLLTNDDTQAIEVLKTLAVYSDNEVATTAQWHLTMAYLQTGELQSAKPLLEGLKGNARFGSYAEKVLAEIE